MLQLNLHKLYQFQMEEKCQLHIANKILKVRIHGYNFKCFPYLLSDFAGTKILLERLPVLEAKSSSSSSPSLVLFTLTTELMIFAFLFLELSSYDTRKSKTLCPEYNYPACMWLPQVTFITWVGLFNNLPLKTTLWSSYGVRNGISHNEWYRNVSQRVLETGHY